MSDLLDADRALELVVENTPRGGVRRVALADGLGSVLAEPLVAAADHPRFARALMDGFAVRHADAGKRIRIVGVAAAGQPTTQHVSDGTGVEIMTGAACPEGTEAVVKVEDVEQTADEAQLPAQVPVGQNLQHAGELFRAGETIAAAGTAISPLTLAAAAACGRAHLSVHAQPRLAIITTGDELCQPGAPLHEGAIHDSNGPMLLAMAAGLGISAPEQLRVADDRGGITTALEQTAEHDIVVLSGGVSMGRRDLVPPVLKELGAQIIFHKVRQKPGKPLLFARLGERLVFGLPGTPLGCHLGFHRYVAASLRCFGGRSPASASRRGRLNGPLRAKCSRSLFRLIRAEQTPEGLELDPLRWRGSVDVAGPVRANGYVRLAPGKHDLPAGAELSWEPVASA